MSKETTVTVTLAECGSLIGMLNTATDKITDNVWITSIWRLCPHWSENETKLELTALYDDGSE